MRLFLVLFSLVIFMNCSTSKVNSPEVDEWLESQNFTVKKPNGWRTVKHHGYVGYTPLNKGHNYFNNLASVFQYQIDNEISLKQFAESQMEKMSNKSDIITQEILNERNHHLGNVYIHKIETTISGEKHKRYTLYFQKNDNFYHFDYSSLKSKYYKHLDEAMEILESITFK